ncbi:MAG: serine/threonine protein kinase [Chloroflexi bacterium]|nr:serine/threonine protein kinase [Chloroflexota bacterium]
MPEPTIGATIGPFTIIEAMPAGHGGMARVYIASVGEHAAVTGASNVESLPERVALKIARVGTPDSASSEQAFYFEALNNEVETLKRLRHPNIVRLFPIPRGLPRNPYAARATELDGMPWFCAMEYLSGGSLESRLKTVEALPLAEAMEIAYQVCLALDHIHLKGMAHLDVKPDNVLFRYPLNTGNVALRHLQPVLIDFGIANKMRKIGPPAGSIPFMAPERIRVMRGEVAPEHFGDQSKVDVYGLGVLLYRMLTGHLPYEGLPRDQLTSAILQTHPKTPREINAAISPKVDELVMATLEKDPGRRPRIEEVITRLDEAMVARPPAPPLIKPAARRNRRPLLTTLLAVALFLCSIVSLVGWGLFAGTALIAPTPTAAATLTSTFTPPPPTDTSTPTATQPPTPTPLAATSTPATTP